MSKLTKSSLEAKVKQSEKLERSDLRGIDLGNATLPKAKLARSDMDGVNLDGANLEGADLTKASMREVFLRGANLRDAVLSKADLDGANLSEADLTNADLSRADLEGANFEGANLTGARLRYAQLDSANFGGANFEGAHLSQADLSCAFLGDCQAKGADLSRALLKGCKLERANFTGANFEEAELLEIEATEVQFTRAKLREADFSRSTLTNIDLSDADMRQAVLIGAILSDVRLNGARVHNLNSGGQKLDGIVASWVDISRDGSGTESRPLQRWLKLLAGELDEESDRTRYVGVGDVLKHAELEFGEGAEVAIDGKLDGCTLKLAPDARLRIGELGQLLNCQVTGGIIEIQGKFLENGRTGLLYPRQLVVTRSGAVAATVEQPDGYTRMGFENGCRLRLKIKKPANDSVTKH